MPDVATVGSIVSAWKLLGALYEKYQGWSVRKRKSKDAELKKLRAEVLMRQINRSILSGASSNDAEVASLVKEFRALIGEDVKPEGHEVTERWVIRSQGGTYIGTPTKKAAARRPAAKTAAAKKPTSRRPASKKVAAKRP